MDQKRYEQICFSIIAAAGTAKSCYLEAIESAKKNEDYESLVQDGMLAFQQASQAHLEALQLDSRHEVHAGLLLIHAETILSGAELVKDLLDTIIELIKKK